MSEPTHPAKPGAAQIREINDTIRYTMWSVFAVAEHLSVTRTATALAAEVEALFAELAERRRRRARHLRRRRPARRRRRHGLVARRDDRAAAGGLPRAACAPSSATTSSRCGRWWRCTARRSSTRATSRRSWPTRRPARYICVYPFVRSYEWYLLDDEERRDMLAEHGKMARDYPDVRANTVASFALGDYEWMLAFEADELHRIVDLMRDLRASDGAPMHVREEVPFYTGPRVPVRTLVHRLR